MMSPTLMAKQVDCFVGTNRKSIGWTSIVIGSLVSTVFFGYTYFMHLERQQAEAIAEEQTEYADRLQDSLQDMLGLSDRPLVVMHAGTQEPGDEMVVFWSHSAEKLFGWTEDDIRVRGIGVLMAGEQDRYLHARKLEAALQQPVGERKTNFIHCDLKLKSGGLMPVVITAWIVGDHSRSAMAFIDPVSNILEQQVEVVP